MAYKTAKTSAGLCNALFEELDLLRNGKSDDSRARSISKLATQIIATKKLELEAANLLQSGVSARPVQLGRKALGDAR